MTGIPTTNVGKRKILLIGGHPKGEVEPFSMKFTSGKRLRAMVAELRLDAQYLDLWEDAASEYAGRLEQDKFNKIATAVLNGYTPVALGLRTQKALESCQEPFGIVCLPHPAARRPYDLKALHDGLSRLAGLTPRMIQS